MQYSCLSLNIFWQNGCILFYLSLSDGEGEKLMDIIWHHTCVMLCITRANLKKTYQGNIKNCISFFTFLLAHNGESKREKGKREVDFVSSNCQVLARFVIPDMLVHPFPFEVSQLVRFLSFWRFRIVSRYNVESLLFCFLCHFFFSCVIFMLLFLVKKTLYLRKDIVVTWKKVFSSCETHAMLWMIKDPFTFSHVCLFSARNVSSLVGCTHIRRRKERESLSKLRESCRVHYISN